MAEKANVTLEHSEALANPPKVLRTHDVRLTSQRATLRAMTEDDWGPLLAWNNDPEVLYFSDGADAQSRDLSEVQTVYRSISANAFCFIIEFEDRAIGECWLQDMNLQRILERYPGEDLRRIDIAIGHSELFRALGPGSWN